MLNERLLARCDDLASAAYWRKAAPLGELFTDDRAARLALPSVGFDAVRCEARAAGKYGNVVAGHVTYGAGPAFRSRPVTVALRHGTVEITCGQGRRVTVFPRSFGHRGETVIGPAGLLPLLSRKPGAWSQSPIRPQMPGLLVGWPGAARPAERRRLFTALGDTAATTSFDSATQAAGQLIRRGGGRHAHPPDRPGRLRPRPRGQPGRLRHLDRARATRVSATVKDIVDAGRAAALTTAVLQQRAAKGTPGQRDYLHGLLTAETASRTASRRARLLKAARLPVVKTLDGYDWAAVTFPADYSREQLTGLTFADVAEDLVYYGDVGTGKTHLAAALIAAACRAGMPARFFTATALAGHLRRAKAGGNLHKELAALAKNRIVAIDELGYIPIDTEGARLLFQVISNSYVQPDHHHEPRVLQAGNRLQ